jgi:hypothetical protein
MSLYESFLLLNMFRMLLRSSSGADDCMWVNEQTVSEYYVYWTVDHLTS